MRGNTQALERLADDAEPAAGEPVVKPKLTALSSDVEESVRHLTREQFAAYASGQLAPDRLSYCQAHLDSCEECREELEDLRTFKSESAFPPPVPNRGVLRQRRRGITLPQAAVIAGIFVAGAAAVLWWRHSSPRADKTSVAAAVARPPAPPATAVASTSAQTPAVPAAPAAATQMPRPHERAPAAPGAGAPQASSGFALLAPLGEVTDTRPEFTWQPLAGAVHYSVVIVDTRLRPVQHSNALHATSWRPRRPLHHGRTYFWQVTATLPGGHKVVASAPGTLNMRDNAPHQSR
jgi:hypothetical protein